MRQWVLLLVLLLLTLNVAAQEQITLDYPRAMLVGDAWLMSLGRLNCETAEIALVNGLTVHRATLEPDADGQAVWGLPAETLTQAGDMLLAVECGTQREQRVVRVLPGTLAEIDAFSVANAITAYGEARTDIIALLSDRYGNPVNPLPNLSMSALYPDGTQAGVAYRLDAGLVVAPLPSRGTPGRVRVTVSAERVQDVAELTQTAAAPAGVRLSAPACVLVDGRDLIPVTIAAVDAYGYPVNDGQTIRLAWTGGGVTAILQDGRGLVRIPAPRQVGTLNIRAPGFDVSVQVALREQCHE